LWPIQWTIDLLWEPAGHKKAISADSCMAAFALARAIGVMAAVAADVGPVQKYCPLFPESRVRVRTGTSLVNLNWTKSAHKCCCVAWTMVLVMVAMLMASALVAVLIVLVVLRVLVVFVVIMVRRNRCWRPISRRNTKYWTPVVHSCVEVPISTASQVDIVDAAEVGSTGLGTASVGEALELQEDILHEQKMSPLPLVPNASFQFL